MSVRRTFFLFAAFAVISLSFQSSALAPIFRPPTATVPGAPSFLWMPYTYSGFYLIRKGVILEFDYGYGVGGPDSPPPPAISFSIADKKVIKFHKWGLHSLNPDLVGGAAFARFFKAVGPGTTTITVRVNSTDYNYDIVVYD